MNRFEVKGDKRYLVIGRVGDTSTHREWLQPAEYKNFDLCLSYFGEQPGRYKDECDFYHEFPGLKWPTVKETIAAFGDGILQYDAIWMPDDDISTNAYDINRMFQLFMKHRLELAQPTLTRDSYYGHKATLNNPSYTLRYSQFIEPMVPIYSRETFMKLLPTFDKSESGWGLDFIWPKLLGYPDKKLAFIDEVTVKHTRPVGGGTLYKNISGSQWEELHRVTREYGVVPDFRVSHYDGIPAGKRVMFALLSRQEEHLIAAQAANIRQFNPEAGIVLYNGGERFEIGKHLEVAYCPASRPFGSTHQASGLWEIMKWLEDNSTKYDYLVVADDRVLFMKPGFESFLDEAMEHYDMMGWDLRDSYTKYDADTRSKAAMWEEWERWQAFFGIDHFVCSIPAAQVYKRELVSKMLAFAKHKEIERRIGKSKVNGLEEVLFPTLAAVCGGRSREYPKDYQLQVMRRDRDVEPEDAYQAELHPLLYTIHPVSGERMVELANMLMSGGITLQERVASSKEEAEEIPEQHVESVIPVVRLRRRRRIRLGRKRKAMRRTLFRTKLQRRKKKIVRSKKALSTRKRKLTSAKRIRLRKRKRAA